MGFALIVRFITVRQYATTHLISKVGDLLISNSKFSINEKLEKYVKTLEGIIKCLVKKYFQTLTVLIRKKINLKKWVLMFMCKNSSSPFLISPHFINGSFSIVIK
jgi:hypothetical protein